MPDKQYTIRISTVADPSGLREITEHTEHAHHGFVHAGTGAREFHQLVHRLAEQSPEYGSALRLLISPVGGAFALASLAAVGFEESMKALQASMSVTEWESYNSVVAATVKGFYDSKIAAAAFGRELAYIKTTAETASEQVDRLTNIHKAQQTAAEKLAEAHEKLELAKAATIQDPVARAEKELEIQNRYAAATERRAQASEHLANVEEHRKLANEQLTATRLTTELANARGAASGIGNEGSIDERIRIEEARLAATQGDIKKVRDQLEEADKYGGEVTRPAKHRILEPVLEGDLETEARQKEFIARLKEARPQEVAAIQAANDTVKRLETELKATTDRIKKLDADLTEHESIRNIEGRARTTVGGVDQDTRIFKMYDTIRQGSHRVAGGLFDAASRVQGGSGSSEDINLLEPMMQMLGANSQNGAKIIAALASQVGIVNEQGNQIDQVLAILAAQGIKTATRLMPGGNP